MDARCPSRTGASAAQLAQAADRLRDTRCAAAAILKGASVAIGAAGVPLAENDRGQIVLPADWKV